MSTFPTRRVARLIVLDARDFILMLRYREYRGNRPSSFWATPGGQLENGERAQDAASRELRELYLRETLVLQLAPRTR
jgi:ADP-ribose pyrophosphatase YjhB (NUDIX family)